MKPSPYARIPRGQVWHEMLARYRAGPPSLGAPASPPPDTGDHVKRTTTRLSLNRDTIRELTALELGSPRGGARNDSLDSPSCNPCGDWPTSPFRGCTL